MITQRPHRPRTNASPGVSNESAPNHRRRAFLAAAFAGSLAIAGVLLLPRGAANPDAKQLLDPAIAKADPQVLRQLCLLYYEHPNVAIRRACAAYSGAFDDAAMRGAHWAMTEDADLQVRSSAVRSILMRDDQGEVAKLVALYRSDQTLRPVIDEFVAAMGMVELEKALRAQ